MSDADATIKALVRALEKAHGKKKPLPAIPIGTRVRVHDPGAAGVGTVVGRDGCGFDGVLVIFDEPAPRGFEDGCCAGVEQCEVLPSEGCHCGQPVAYGYDGDPTHSRGMCEDCDSVRCDAYPGACRALPPGSDGPA